ncbi:hypothetical protein SKAU_G00423060 [Synaphobranchus kaupii]|uniref:Uncharacterized protein n=1 Tax=Synaphobranchus kaupii TaxID=118154 RepID=A0A9Q1E5C1_SYNKA|nr:hypothetical protein SKAU_G00423060 [Synaphobranchus kaupii]
MCASELAFWGHLISLIPGRAVEKVIVAHGYESLSDRADEQGLLTLCGVCLYLTYSHQALEELQRQVGPELMAHMHLCLGVAWLAFALEDENLRSDSLLSLNTPITVGLERRCYAADTKGPLWLPFSPRSGKLRKAHTAELSQATGKHVRPQRASPIGRNVSAMRPDLCVTSEGPYCVQASIYAELHMLTAPALSLSWLKP